MDATKLVGASEIVEIAGRPLLAFPRGRHAALRARTPRATVCVPCCGDASGIAETLASLRAQTFDDFGVVIVDDASRGDTFALACGVADAHPRAVAYQHPRAIGRIETWNRCLDLAVGEYTKLLPPGERLHPDFLRRLVAMLDVDPDVALARAATTADAPFASTSELTGAIALVHALTGEDPTGPVGAQLVRRAVVEGSRLRFRPELGPAAAFEWSLRLLARGDFAYDGEALCERPVADPPRPPIDGFCEAAEARLSALRDLPAALEPVVVVKTIERVAALHREARRALEAGDGAADPRALDRRYAAVLEELALQLRRAADAPGGRATRADEGARARLDARPALAHLLAQADADTRAHRYQAAEVPIRRILAADPWNLEALNDLGVLRYHQADLVGARKYLASVLALDPGNPLARENLALLANP